MDDDEMVVGKSIAMICREEKSRPAALSGAAGRVEEREGF